MTPQIEKMLKKEQPPENIQNLLDDIKGWLSHSRSKMGKRYEQWDRHQDVFEGKRESDDKDARARESGEPEQMIVPTSYTQVMTFVTFCFMLYKQGPNFFQFGSTGNEDYPLEQSSMSMIERDLRWNQFSSLLFQILLDVARFGIAATKTTYVEVRQPVRSVVVIPGTTVGPFTMGDQEVEDFTEELKYEGSKIQSISPYRLLPDMRLPLTRWKEGRFVGDEQEYHISYLYDKQRQGMAAGVEFVEKLTEEDFKASHRYQGQFPDVEGAFSKQKSGHVSRAKKGSKKYKEEKRQDSDFMVISTELHVKLNPKKYDLEDINYDVDYLITIANDNRIVRIERANYIHGEFIYDITMFTPDEHMELSLALTDTIKALQDVVTWLINARIMSLRQGLDRHLVVDPTAIDINGLTNRSPIIFKKQGSPGMPLSNFIQQINYKDISAGNMAEAESLMGVIQMVTGVNENAMGQYSPGRRSASENQAANRGAASRMTLHAMLIWDQLIGPVGKKLLINHRQQVSIETFIKVVGETSPDPAFQTIDELYSAFVPESVTELVGNEDYFVLDSSGQGEKQYQAQALQELTMSLVGNPEVLALTQYDLTKLIDGIQQLRGVRNVARFKSTTPINPALAGQPVIDPVTGQPVPPAAIGGNSTIPGQPAV